MEFGLKRAPGPQPLPSPMVDNTLINRYDAEIRVLSTIFIVPFHLHFSPAASLQPSHKVSLDLPSLDCLKFRFLFSNGLKLISSDIV